MRTYTIRILRTATKALAKIDARYRRRIEDAIEALAQDPRPHGVVKIVGGTNEYRIRVGSYRVRYRIDDDIRVVSVDEIGTRQNFYDGR